MGPAIWGGALWVGAVAHGRTLAQQVEYLMRREAFRERFAEAREAMRRNPPDGEYFSELREWQSDAWN